MQITVANLSVELIRKNIKNMHLYIMRPDGKIKITAPARLSEEKIRSFILSKLDWIYKQQEKIKNEPRVLPQTFSHGETLYIFGKPYSLEVIVGKYPRKFVFSGNRAILYDKKESSTEQREKAVNEGLRLSLKAKVEELLPKWEKITGLHPSSFQIKKMKSRWGTCNTSTKKIWLNLELAHKKEECVDYVILHEICHLKVANHGKDFIALMDRYMPRWKELKKELNDIK